MIISMSEYLDVEAYHYDDHDDCHNDREEIEVQETQHCCSGCMFCLGLSWRDFT